MEHCHLDAVKAFHLMTRLSQATNLKLHDVGARLVADATSGVMAS